MTVTSPSAVLDDIDARPGSTTSYLRTLIGLYLRDLGGWIAIADLIALLADLGIAEAPARTGVQRLKQKGLLVAEARQASGYSLNAAAETMLARGDRRIFAVRTMSAADEWCLVSFSIPESRRDARHQLRRRLQWIGCGQVAPALWICPEHLTDEVNQILGDLGVRDHATLFRASPLGPVDAAAWWDLDGLARVHHEFQATVAQLAPEHPLSDRESFVTYVRLIDAWRMLPYVDPGLPAALLPADWPGRRSIEQFETHSARLAPAARAHVRAVTASA